MTQEDVKYYRAENRHIWRLMGWSLAWVIAGGVCLWTGATLARSQYPRWVDYLMIALAACAHVRGIMLSYQVRRLNDDLNKWMEQKTSGDGATITGKDNNSAEGRGE